MDKTMLKLVTLKSSDNLNIQKRIEEHVEALNVAKDNGSTKFIGELDKLRQILEENNWFYGNWWTERYE